MKPRTHGALRLLMLGLPLLAGGCAVFTVGESEFGCPGRPAGVRCMTATDVYAATEHADRIEASAPDALGGDPRRMKENPATPANDATRDGAAAPRGAVQMTSVVALAERPLPVRTPARIMRVWIASWEDTKGVLHTGGYHFTEIEERRWSIGEEAVTEPVRFFSIQPRADPVKGAGRSRLAGDGGAGE